MEKDKALVKMAFANVNQVEGKGVKSEWVIRANQTDEELGRLPAHLDVKQTFAILHLIRKYELEALNIGINTGKRKTVLVYDKMLNDLQHKLTLATKENERIADALERVTNKQLLTNKN